MDISFVSVGGVRLRLGLTGNGPPLLFLFGSGAAGTIDNAKPLVDRFAPHFTVACPDQRGLGESDIPPGPWTMADYANDAFGVADHLGWDRFSVIGLSFGGMVAWGMAVTQPARLERMVLWGCSPGGSAHSYPLHLLADLPDADRQRMFAELMDIRLAGQWDREPTPERMLVQEVLRRGGTPFKDDDPRREGLALQLEARRHHDVLRRLGQIECPTLIGAGNYDGLAPVANAEAMYAGIPSSRMKVYEAGHFFYLGKQAFNDGLSFLLDAQPPAPQGTALTAEQLADRFSR